MKHKNCYRYPKSQKEIIINCVIETIKTTVESENDYKEKVKAASQKGKRLPSYRDFFNTSLLYYTLGMYLIALQTSILEGGKEEIIVRNAVIAVLRGLVDVRSVDKPANLVDRS